ncbi:MAG TPA: LysM peptidoglycan-binding domain-containing protein, partial [Anaerolineales bacterium]
MAQPIPVQNIQANITGDTAGQIAVGNYNLQIGSVHGGIVNIGALEHKPQPRPAPVLLLPGRFPGLLDRVEETGRAAACLPSGQPVEIYGVPGLGKTALLRSLARLPFTAAFQDGIVYLSARRQPLGDLLQALFDAFYETEAPSKQNEAQIRFALQAKRALILLDDLDLDREEIQSLFDVAPNCAFLLASDARSLWGEGLALALPGLPTEAALALIERELGRPLDEAELPAARQLSAALQGHPLSLLQAAALARETGRPLSAPLIGNPQVAPVEKLAAQALASLSEPEKRILAAIAALEGAPLEAEHLPALSGLSDPAAVVNSLLARGLIQAHSPRYTLADNLSLVIERSWDLAAWRERVLAHYLAWVEGQPRASAAVLRQSEAVMHLAEWAARPGHWGGALRLARGLDAALSLGKRWEAWAAALRLSLQAAEALDDQAARAWALHQLGTRSLCLGERGPARDFLVRALRLRQSLGDRAGTAVTRHNLTLLFGPPAPRDPGQNPPRSPSGPAGKPFNPWPVLNILAAPVIVGLFLAVWLSSRGPSPQAIAAPPSPAASASPFLPQTGTVAGYTLTETSLPTGQPATAVTLLSVTSSPTPEVLASNTPSPTPEVLASATPSPIPCTPIRGWPAYRIQPGDTLYGLAIRTGSSVSRLMAANCLTSTLIYAGQILYVPHLPPTDTATFTTTPTQTITPTSIQTITPIPTQTITLTPTETLTPVPTLAPQLFADLRIASVEAGYVSTEKGQPQVMVAFVVVNQGEALAEPFEAEIRYYSPVNRKQVSFPAAPVRFSSEADLQPGGRISFHYLLTLDPAWQGQTIILGIAAALRSQSHPGRHRRANDR